MIVSKLIVSTNKKIQMQPKYKTMLGNKIDRV